MSSPDSGSGKGFSLTEWLVLLVAVIGFAFDIYELLMLPVISGPALSELLRVPPEHPDISKWFGRINAAAAISGGIFGLLGGYLIDRFGRKRILGLSILVYGVSPVLAAFSTSPIELLIFRCTTFIGVCVEFVAAVAWLAELFPEPKKRESVLGITQAFSSIGGLMVSGMSLLLTRHGSSLPALPIDPPFDPHAAWRYTLISGLIPAIPIAIILPFLPESPVWRQRKAEGKLKRPSIGELFTPALRRTTIITTILFACAYGAAFGAIQLTPVQIAPGVPELAEQRKGLAPLRTQASELYKKFDATEPNSDARQEALAQIKGNLKEQRTFSAPINEFRSTAQLWQEMGGLVGRVIFAAIAIVILSRRAQLRMFLIPGLAIIPWFFFMGSQQSSDMLLFGIGAAALVTVAQLSYLGNYLPAAYPVHLRGTAGGFTANVGGRMIGGMMSFVTTGVILAEVKGYLPQGTTPFKIAAFSAGIMGTLMFLIALIASFFLPEPKATETELNAK
ncbi:MFS transporter [Telmatocola sphagniphila]|uniref:MFS transporter n=1 Tax=Telmatocola sphagniphila TaxID=1123043 RepID=A0A8E6B9H1_9BACT|nr:MFS transporter [Telmatocola sphagniphila]QVL33018.1 MFS transporter [Telmatocola sphagniphila]